MAKAVPVFRFAFAAYAASCGAAAREQRESRFKPSRKTGFLQTWKVFSAESGLRVKIGVRDSENGEAVAEPKEASEDYREIWLGEIKETASAFSGVVRKGGEALRHIRPGQRIGFDPTHILDWSVGAAAEDGAAPSLSEIVSS